MSHNFKTILVGEAKVGKTTFIKRLLTGVFTKEYVPTLGVEVRPYTFNNCKFDVWDRAGQEKFKGLGHGYYIGAKCAIIMFDSSAPESALKWYKSIRKVCGNIPIVFVYNGSHPIEFQVPDGCDYVEMSVESGTNVFRPFKLLYDKLYL